MSIAQRAEYMREGGTMASKGGDCTRDGGLALAYTAVVPVMGNWLAKAYC